MKEKIITQSVERAVIRRLFKRNFNKANKARLRRSYFKMAETIGDHYQWMRMRTVYATGAH